MPDIVNASVKHKSSATS